MGIANYNKECRQIVMRYSSEWEVSTTDLDLPAVIVFCCEYVCQNYKANLLLADNIRKGVASC